ncbi:MAG: hypothetical protein ACRDJO_13290 [Actinomycetota bacterium]
MGEQGPILGRGLGRLTGRSASYERGRQCTHPDCTTTVSMYNPTERCFLHSAARRPRLRGRPTDVMGGPSFSS